MTAPDLLQAVGVTGGNNIDLFSVQGGETVTVREALAKQWAFADEQVIYTGPIFECIQDEVFTIPLRLELSLSKLGILEFTFHPIGLHIVMRQALATIAKKLEDSLDKTPIYHGA